MGNRLINHLIIYSISPQPPPPSSVSEVRYYWEYIIIVLADNKATPSVSVKSAKVNSFHLTQRRGERLYALSQATNDPLQVSNLV